MNLKDCKTLEEVRPFVEAKQLYAVDPSGRVWKFDYSEFIIKLTHSDKERKNLAFCVEANLLVWLDVFTSEQIANMFAENLKKEALKKEYDDIANQMSKLLKRMIEIRHLLPQEFTEEPNDNQLYNALKNSKEDE